MGDEDLTQPATSKTYYHKYALTTLHKLSKHHPDLYESLVTDLNKQLGLNSNDGEESSDEETDRFMERLSKKRRSK